MEPLRLELGCGANPTPGYVHHDRWQHSDHVDVAWDLDVLPWPFRVNEAGLFGIAFGMYWGDLSTLPAGVAPLPDAFLDEILAIDVFEHLRLDPVQWLDECWRLLRPGGKLEMRLPAWDNENSYRDPTHRRLYHQDSFLYWDPEPAAGFATRLWADFGRYYFAAPDRPYARWWRQESAVRENFDWRYVLVKRGEASA